MRLAAAACVALLSLISLPASPQEAPDTVDPLGMTVQTRFAPPAGYEREAVAGDSFAAYLRQLPLKAHGAQVKLYDGRTKPNRNTYAAVVDLAIGRRDLHQCADAIIRLRAEYLHSRGRYDEIRFRFSSGFPAEFARWRRGERIIMHGNRASWQQRAAPSAGYRDLWEFLEMVFTYAGTASLARELAAAPGDDPRSGDVFIQPGLGPGGRAGHAVIVVDSALNRADGRSVFLLAQSYMPAQEIQVLLNPNDARLGPWYASAFRDRLVTPEWTFKRTDLKRFLE